MTPHEFIEKWKPVALTERATAHSHFLDLCALLGHDDPVKADPLGEWFTFEKGVTKTGGGDGFADVWKRNHFAWEYKKKKRDLNAALDQLVRYAAALENPPLQVACDTDRFLIRTAWTNAVPKTYELTLDDLAEPQKLDILRAVFFEPEKLRPKETRAGITKEAADKFSTIALRLQGRGAPEDIAHFVNQLVFCFFAHSVKLLPEGFFPKLLKRAAQKPERAKDYLDQLFAAMETGGEFDLTDIAHFNGGLFDGRRALPLDSGDIGLLIAAGSLDWSLIDPTIFGTLFERFLDPDKRAQIGAHYTDPGKIMMIIDPVILRPLREEWAQAKAAIDVIVEEVDAFRQKAFSKAGARSFDKQIAAGRAKAEAVRDQFIERLRKITILDPACGSGNFLYLALQGVKDIELKANLECEAMGLAPRAPVIGPEIVHGIEINAFAAELARTTIWIGDIQWRLRNGIYARPQPILRNLDAIECRDALLKPIGLRPARDNPAVKEMDFAESVWPDAEFIVGNPPFLGGKLMRSALGDGYVSLLREIYKDRVSNFADFVCYWFEKAFLQIKLGCARRCGLVATNSIRGGASRDVLESLLSQTRIFEAWSDEPWVVDGAAVRVSLICFGRGSDRKMLDGAEVERINPDLTSSRFDLTRTERLLENQDVCFEGGQPHGPFDVEGSVARSWLEMPVNPNGKTNSEVLRPYVNAMDLARRSSDRWMIDVSHLASEAEVALYEAPYAHLREHVYPVRQAARDPRKQRLWWVHHRSRPALRKALRFCSRAIVTPVVAKHRFFVWTATSIWASNLIDVIARDDDTIFGILHSRFHEAWSLRLCTWLGVGNDPRYTPTTTFETFPFPEGLTPNIPAKDYANDPRAIAIAKAAKRLDELRNKWLNPPDLVCIEPEVVPGYPDRILPKDTVAAATLRERTLTKLYNLRPQWLLDAHRDLDAAVAAAYGWPADISEEDALAKLLELNLARAGTGSAASPAEAADADDED